MYNILEILNKKDLIDPPNFIITNLQYLTIMGSMAYGCEDKDSSDFDMYGFCIPPKELIFPHVAGEILGFGKQKKRFNQ